MGRLYDGEFKRKEESAFLAITTKRLNGELATRSYARNLKGWTGLE